MSSDLVVGEKAPFLSNKRFDQLKWLAQIGFPALGALYFGIAQIWGLPKAEEVVGTITVIDIFLGALLGLSSKAYNNSEAKYDGTLVVNNTDDDVPTHQIEFKQPLEELDGKTELTVKVENPTD